jgi:hypothetical protein
MWTALAVAAAWPLVLAEAWRTRRAPEVASSSATPAANLDVIPPAPRPMPDARRNVVIDYAGVPVGLGKIEGVLPTEESGHGDATLRLRLIGDADGNPVAMKYLLWRLGVPESADWTAGDQIECVATAPDEDVVWKDLAPGRYRLQCIDARDGGVDPPEFTVAHGANDVCIAVPNRRTFRLRLLLAGEDGAARRRCVRTSKRRDGGWCGTSGERLTPDLAEVRRPRIGRSEDTIFVGMGGSWLDEDQGRDGPLGAEPDRYFDVGFHIENGRRLSFSEYAADNAATVCVNVDDAIGVDTTFVGAAPSHAALLAHVTANGRPLDPSAAKVEAKSDAIRCPWDAPADAWRTIPVHVKVTCDGFEPLAFDWTAATAGAEHPLVPLPPKSSK